MGWTELGRNTFPNVFIENKNIFIKEVMKLILHMQRSLQCLRFKKKIGKLEK